MSGYQTIAVKIEGGVARLTLNRPEVLNALSLEMAREIRAALDDLRGREDVRVLLMTGNGRAFCAGADLKDPMMGTNLPPGERGKNFSRLMDSDLNALVRDLYHFEKPKIAAVNGAAVGGGMALAMLADIAVAAKSAYFLLPFTAKLNLLPDMGLGWHLTHRLGHARALGVSLLGDKLPAETAAEWGLIWQCVADEDLTSTAEELAARIGAAAPMAAAKLPRLLDQALRHDFDHYLNLDRDQMRELVDSEDYTEALAAFAEKRAPKFTGR